MTTSATKHLRTIVEVDEYLRRHAVGSRFHVTGEHLADALNLSLTEARAAMQALVRIKDSGLTAVKNGACEYVTPKYYPEELRIMRDSLRTVVPASPAVQPGTNPPRRGNLTSEVMEWFDNHRGQPHSIRRVADAIHARPESVASSCHRLYKNGWLVSKADSFGKGFYERPREEEHVPDRIPTPAELHEMVTPRPVAPVSPEPPRLETPSLNGQIPEGWFKQMTTTKTGRIVVQSADGSFYRLVDL